ncbi:unnamed protein product [Amoebophrya sp. A120]|nr:unnamed protein product [Amoebophrya sp. A120]|eukprot:GSA120T00021956001.1
MSSLKQENEMKPQLQLPQLRNCNEKNKKNNNGELGEAQQPKNVLSLRDDDLPAAIFLPHGSWDDDDEEEDAIPTLPALPRRVNGSPRLFDAGGAVTEVLNQECPGKFPVVGDDELVFISSENDGGNTDMMNVVPFSITTSLLAMAAEARGGGISSAAAEKTSTTDLSTIAPLGRESECSCASSSSSVSSCSPVTKKTKVDDGCC